MAKKLAPPPLPLPPTDKNKAGSWGHASGRIWSREKDLMGRSGLDRLYAASSEEEVKRLLLEHRYPQKETALAMLAAERDQLYQFLAEIVPDDGFYQLLLLGDDALNLKTALKIALLAPETDQDRFKSLMSRPSLLEGDLLWRALVRGEEETGLPDWAAQVAARARLAYGDAYDLAAIDRSVDRDMHSIRADLALSLKTPWLTAYGDMVRDLINLETLLRARQHKMSPELFAANLLPDGLIDRQEWLRYYENDNQVCIDDFCDTPYKGLSGHFVTYGDKGGPALFSLDRDQILAQHLESGCQTLSGAPRVIAYVMAREYEFKNIRLVMSSLAHGLDHGEVQALRRDFRKG